VTNGRSYELSSGCKKKMMATEQGKILIVDDNRINRITLSRSVEQQGHVVSLAEDGQQALDMIGSEEFDVVLLDIIMPEMDGYQVLERVKSDPKTRDIPVIVISALDEIDSAVRCIEIGAEDYLPKPFNPVLLRARLNASLEKKKLRDLEKAYLQQEMMLRQSEKLATLGKLSAGMAHELNNPAAATQRGAEQLAVTFSRLMQTQMKLGELELTDSHLTSLMNFEELAQKTAKQPVQLDTIMRSDREDDLMDWLEELGVENSWEVAPNLVNLGYDTIELISKIDNFNPPSVPVVVEWVNCMCIIYTLLEEIGHGAKRISAIIGALKDYTYMDQAPIQIIDIHEGLESTLTILSSKLNNGIQIQREYEKNLPAVEAYGSELNQVWTNIIDNAIDAIDGDGEITLRTHSDDQWAVIEIEDSGSGIPESIQPKLFDPFFTTKPPGEGAGLGLNVTHNIIVNKHKGRIDVFSHPGMTRFEVRLPLNTNDRSVAVTDN
jgi:signal transduction histidine kinase